ncbi:MAG: hypothetical protein QOG80_1070 [Pseudonocardiales bacterium]|nr:hypothetical protein [Pseudonocardiales bacterium]
MAYINEGDWGGENLPLVFREHIREVDMAVAHLVASLQKLAASVAGFAEGAERAKVAQHV